MSDAPAAAAGDLGRAESRSASDVAFAGPEEVAAPHAVSAEAVARRLRAEVALGLAPVEVERRRARDGWNELPEPPPEPLLRRLIAQFKGIVVGTLLVAAVVAAALGERIDAVAIVAIVLMNGVLGFFTEARAGRALAALRRLSAPGAKAVRGGVAEVIAARDLVPGDLISLEAGDAVPADARLVAATGLRVKEAALTGESEPVDKDAGAVLAEATPLADRRNSVFFGTIAVAGKAAALVTATGARTEIGKIAAALGAAEREPTPLERRLAELGRVLVFACLGAVAVVAVVHLARGGGLGDVFLLGVSLAVVAIPEGLPAVVTVALALGLHRMVLRHVLVRKLPSVETLGCVTVICSDKTGTLTRNEMAVERVLASPAARPLLLTAAVRCNHARLVPREGSGFDATGDPTEVALLLLAARDGVLADATKRVLSEVPFDSARKTMSVVTEERPGEAAIFTKGAPEVVLAMCSREVGERGDAPLDEARRAAILAAGEEMARAGLRVLALAAASRGTPAASYAEGDLVFLGLAGMRDPPRPEARAAVERCHEAGIRPVMITGDHPGTARAIAREVGIAAEGDEVATGADLDGWSEADLDRRVERIAIFARVAAEHKLRIVRALKRRGHVVAMTGDGVNDATALQAADIGIAMGRGGTDVAKEAAAMVLTDDDFASIVAAIEEGRGIYDNIQKFVRYLLSCSVGAVLFMFAAGVAGWPVPLFPTQLLWVNLVTNGLPALALGLEPVEAGVMRRRPRPPGESMMPRRMRLEILAAGLLLGIAPLAAFAAVYVPRPDDLGLARTVAFCGLVFSQLLFALAARSERTPLARLGLGTNPYLLGAIGLSGVLQLAVVLVPALRPIFQAHALAGREWALIAALREVPLAAIEIAKVLWARRRRA